MRTVMMAERSRALFILFVLASAFAVLAVSCKEDDSASQSSPGGSDGGATTADAGGDSPSTPPSGEDSGAPDDGGKQSPPGTGLVLPRDAFLLTDAKPINIDTVTEVVVSSSLQYLTAYNQTVPNDKAEKFRFIARTHDTGEEVPSGGVKIWWRVISGTTGEATYYICRVGKDVSGEIRYSLILENNAGTDAEPDTVYRNQCSWTFWKHPTDDAWAIRAPKGTSTPEKGMVVTKQHATANEAYSIRVEGSFVDEAPFFRLKSMM